MVPYKMVLRYFQSPCLGALLIFCTQRSSFPFLVTQNFLLSSSHLLSSSVPQLDPEPQIEAVGPVHLSDASALGVDGPGVREIHVRKVKSLGRGHGAKWRQADELCRRNYLTLG
jgi:hypothetical protein